MSLQSLLHEPAVSEGTTSFSGLPGFRDRASFSVIVVSGARCELSERSVFERHPPGTPMRWD